MTTKQTQRGFIIFARAIRQLSSLCTLLGDPTAAFWFGCVTDQTFHEFMNLSPPPVPGIPLCGLLSTRLIYVRQRKSWNALAWLQLIYNLNTWVFFSRIISFRQFKPLYRVGVFSSSSLFAWVRQTGCGMWTGQRIPLGVGRKGVTFLFVRIKGWQPQRREPTGGAGRSGSPGVARSYHHIHSCWGWAGREDEGRKNIFHDVHSSSTLDNEVDPVKHCGAAARHEWMTSLDKQRLK